ncbi:MAG: class I SAM-dependent methyltransferase [Oscillospiraceae bacterium]
MLDNGKEIDWSKASADYAKYRDIYPDELYTALSFFGIGKAGQHILDIGTGTGVIVRRLYKTGAVLTGTDIAENQIHYARTLSADAGMDIRYEVSGAECLPFADNSFDAATAFQCWMYVDKARAVPELSRVLKPGGKLVIGYMAWLPEENEIVRASLETVNSFNPDWNGFDKRAECAVPAWADAADWARKFRMTAWQVFDADIPFTYESWNGRMKASRGVGASLSAAETERFSQAHLAVLKSLTADIFTIRHEIALMVFENLKG